MPSYQTPQGKIYLQRGLPYHQLKDQMLRVIEKHPGITTGQLQQKIAADIVGEDIPSTDTIKRHGRQLENAGLIVIIKVAVNRQQWYHKSFTDRSLKNLRSLNHVNS